MGAGQVAPPARSAAVRGPTTRGPMTRRRKDMIGVRFMIVVMMEFVLKENGRSWSLEVGGGFRSGPTAGGHASRRR